MFGKSSPLELERSVLAEMPADATSSSRSAPRTGATSIDDWSANSTTTDGGGDPLAKLAASPATLAATLQEKRALRELAREVDGGSTASAALASDLATLASGAGAMSTANSSEASSSGVLQRAQLALRRLFAAAADSAANSTLARVLPGLSLLKKPPDLSKQPKDVQAAFNKQMREEGESYNRAPFSRAAGKQLAPPRSTRLWSWLLFLGIILAAFCAATGAPPPQVEITWKKTEEEEEGEGGQAPAGAPAAT